MVNFQGPFCGYLMVLKTVHLGSIPGRHVRVELLLLLLLAGGLAPCLGRAACFEL